MPREWTVRVEDMLTAIAKIDRFTAGLAESDFLTDELRQDATIRCLEVIGEAARHVPDAVKAKAPGIPWPLMTAIRNILAHEYFGADLKIVWKTATEDLPPLRPALEKLFGR